MTASPDQATTSSTGSPRDPLRVQLRDTPEAGHVDGGWWPRSRDLRAEAADLIDHLPTEVGRVHRLLFSRPDWDDGVVDGKGRRRIEAARGPVKTGSFPGDDTHQMILVLASGRQLRLLVIPSDTDPAEAEQQLRAAAGATPAGRGTQVDRT
ncbi:hypothetical protein G5V58_20950 [Nocardioides anomalus]|uniref:Uncharacterized protein n=1 Tax=Nocardioides anomalus TaxID=2712223 RepID=A0A6G6WIE0_9ACTN|nr:DUF5994 family protein [Nocardioides anomalus]QIG44913.1 hypothetical protein G5V58_20950 [Nocardioides anomalus]